MLKVLVNLQFFGPSHDHRKCILVVRKMSTYVFSSLSRIDPFCCPWKRGVLQIVLPANYRADHLVNDDVKSLGTGLLFLITVFLF